MSVILNEVRRSTYLDSIVLMRISRQVVVLPGVEEAGLVIGTPANKEILREARILGPDGDKAEPTAGWVEGQAPSPPLKIAANGPLALIASKEISNGGGDWTAAERWDEMARVMGPVFTSQDAREGARAFAEKRAPVWKGQ